MTDAASVAGDAVSHVPDLSVVAAYGHLLADARAVLEAWQAPDADQGRLRLDYLDHLATRPDGVAKAGPPAHLTASCVVLDPTGGQVLLTLHRRANAWFQLGGHLEVGDPTLWAAARREAREESGIDTLEPLPRPVQLDRHTARRVLRHLPRAPRRAVRGGGAGRGDGPGSARSRTTSGGGRPTRCRRAPATSSRRWCHSRADALGLG